MPLAQLQILDWTSLQPAERVRTLARPASAAAVEVCAEVARIISRVRSDGDRALRELTRQFDAVELAELEVGSEEFAAAEATLDADAIGAIERAIETVSAFHRAQITSPVRVQTAPGVWCERLSVPIGAVGLYVPAGSAPLPSTAIMLAVPARIAGCPQRIMCTPPDRSGAANAAVLVAAHRAGIRRVFKVGGAQAVAALAYGTASIPKCDKIYGPGNAYVTAAKLAVAGDPAGAAFDLPAGVSEVMVIADQAANAEFVAADLLAQAEHGVDAQAILATDSKPLAAAVAAELSRQVARLSRTDILARSFANIRLIVTASIEAAVDLANRYAPEHLILETQRPREWLPLIRTAGAVFLGQWSCESIGDYCAGPNHTLPTYGYARSYSGLSVEDFQRRMSVQELSAQGLRELGPTARTLAQLEGLDGHAASVTCRLDALQRDLP